MRYRMQLLGGLRLDAQDRAITQFPTQKARSLLAYLAFYRSKRHSREFLATLLWPDAEPENGRNSLKTELKRLRDMLGEKDTPGALIEGDRQNVWLNEAVLTTDVGEFEALLRKAHRTQKAEERAELLQQAIALYAGPLAAELYEEWASLERDRLAKEYLDALHGAARDMKACGRIEQAVACARKAMLTDPLSEASCEELMRLYLAQDRASEALRLFREFEMRLKAELAMAPGRTLRELAEECLARSAETLSSSKSAPPPVSEAPLSAEVLSENPDSPPVKREPVAAPEFSPQQSSSRLTNLWQRRPTRIAFALPALFLAAVGINRVYFSHPEPQNSSQQALKPQASSSQSQRFAETPSKSHIPQDLQSQTSQSHIPKSKSTQKTDSGLQVPPSEDTETHVVLYIVDEVEPLPGDTETIACDINDSGTVIGYSGSQTPRALIWDTARFTRPLPGLDAGYSAPYSINNSGVVTGGRDTGGGHAFVCPLPGLDTQRDLELRQMQMGYCINAQGQVVGMYHDQNALTACIWDPIKGRTDIEAVTGQKGKLESSVASCINNRGQVAGEMNGKDKTASVFLWSNSDGLTLPKMPVNTREAHIGGLNDAGEIVGRLLKADMKGYPFWCPATGKAELLPMPKGKTGSAEGINNLHQIVGHYEPYDGEMRAALWTKAEGMRDLNDLIPADAGWVLAAARRINDQGQIVGWGYHNEKKRGYVLMPIKPNPPQP